MKALPSLGAVAAPALGVATVGGVSLALVVGAVSSHMAHVGLVALWAAGLVAVCGRWLPRGAVRTGLGRSLGAVRRAVRDPIGTVSRVAGASRDSTLLALLGVAIIWRVMGLTSAPANLLGDEFSQAAEAVRFLKGELTNPFATSHWYGVPLAAIWLGSLAFRVAGPEPWVWRLVTGLGAALAIPLTYLAVRAEARIADGNGATPTPRTSSERIELVAVLAATYLAFHHMHLYFSRIGSNQGYDATFVALQFALVALARRSPSNSLLWYVAGVVSGLGFHFYFALRGIAGITTVTILAWALRRRIPASAPAWFFLGMLLAVMPLLASTTGTDRLGGRTIQVLSLRLHEGQAAGLAIAERAVIGLSSIQGRPLKGWYEGSAGLLITRMELLLLIVGGLAYLRSGRRLAVVYLVGIVGLVALMTENPVMSQRVTGATMPAAVLVAWGARHVAGLASRRHRANLAFALVAALCVANATQLFLVHMPRRTIDMTALVATELASLLATRPEIEVVHMCGGSMGWHSSAVLGYLHPGITAEPIEPESDGPPRPLAANAAIVTTPSCIELRDRLTDGTDLVARQLVIKTNFSKTAALKMYAATGGVGYLRFVDLRSAQEYGPDDREVFSIFVGADGDLGRHPTAGLWFASSR